MTPDIDTIMARVHRMIEEVGEMIDAPGAGEAGLCEPLLDVHAALKRVTWGPEKCAEVARRAFAEVLTLDAHQYRSGHNLGVFATALATDSFTRGEVDRLAAEATAALDKTGKATP